MSMDAILLGKVVHWLHPLIGAELQTIYSANEHILYFFFKTTSNRVGLKVDTTPLESHLSLVDERPEVTLDTPYFLSLFRKHLVNGTLLKIEQVQDDRIIELSFQVPDEIGRLFERHLVIELMGRATNVILTKEDDQIIDALHRVPPSELTHRTIHPGAFYRRPPHYKNPSLYNAAFSALEPLENQVAGLSDILVAEINYRMVQGESFETIRDAIQSSQSLYLTRSAKKSYLHVIPLTHVHGTSTEVSWSEAVNAFYLRDRLDDETNRLRLQATAHLKKVIKKLNQRKLNFSNDLKLADDRDLFKFYGQQLLAFIDEVPAHATSFTVPYSDPLCVIPLRPEWSASGNADYYFKKYKKLTKSIQILHEQIAITDNLIAHYEYIVTILDDADAPTLKQILAELGVIKLPPPRGKQPVKLKLLEFLTPSQTTILVGRNSAQNDYLTFTFAKPTDTFFHVHQLPGSHVCIRHPNPSPADITLAGELAAYYSSARNSSKVEVQWCPIQTVKKIPGSTLGQVRLQKFQSALFTPHPHPELKKGD